MNDISQQVAENARAQAEPKIRYVVEAGIGARQGQWQVYRVNEVGMYSHVANYDHKAPADRVAETLNHWASEESTS